MDYVGVEVSFEGFEVESRVPLEELVLDVVDHLLRRPKGSRKGCSCGIHSKGAVRKIHTG